MKPNTVALSWRWLPSIDFVSWTHFWVAAQHWLYDRAIELVLPFTSDLFVTERRDHKGRVFFTAHWQGTTHHFANEDDLCAWIEHHYYR
ncbi:MAG: hypothetical protein OHK0012_01260 [Synechococcales cyanobacterium]